MYLILTKRPRCDGGGFRSISGCIASFNDLLTAPPGPGESGDGWAASEQTRFGRYAMRLWSGLLDCEEVRDR